MKNFFKQFGKAICYFLLYFGIQNIVGLGIMMVYIVEKSFELAGTMQAANDLGMAASDVDAITLGAIDYMMQNQNAIVIISGIVTILVLLISFLIRKKNLLAEANVTKMSLKYVPVAMGLGLSMMLTISFGFSLLPESWMATYSAKSDTLVSGSPIVMIISTMIMAPLIEELIFRGLMLSRLKKAASVRVAIVITSLLFGLMHGQIIWMIYTFALGIVLSIVVEKTGSIVSSILLHMTFNICGIVIPMLLGDAVSGALCVVIMIIGALLSAVLLTWLFKMNKKENDALQTA